MDQPEKCALASAYQNQDIIWVRTESGFRDSAYDPQGKETVLRVDADDNALGVAVTEALAQSRFLSLEEARTFLDYRIGMKIYDERIRSLVESEGYKNKAALFRRMKHCSITLEKGIIKIGPTIHDGSNAWGRNKSDGLEDVVIASDRPVNEIGTALRLGFSRSVE